TKVDDTGRGKAVPTERVDGPHQVVAIAVRADVGVDGGIVIAVRRPEIGPGAVARYPLDDRVGAVELRPPLGTAKRPALCRVASEGVVIVGVVDDVVAFSGHAPDERLILLRP